MSAQSTAPLSRVAVFEAVEQEELETLMSCCSPLEVDVGATVIKEGESSRAFYLIVEGALDVILPEDSETAQRFSQVRLSTLEEGDCFGEYAFLDRRAASASVVATKPCKLLKIEGARLEALLDGNDHVGRIIYKNLLRLLVKRLRDNNAEVDLTFDI